MNSFTKKVAKAVVTGIVLSGVLMSTACSQPVTAPTESPSASQSASATPSPSPTPSPVITDSKGPMGVDISEVMTNRVHDGVKEIYPNETKETLTEGVTFALTTYEGLVAKNNFYQKRTDSDVTLLFPDADKFEKTYYDAMVGRTTANNGVMTDIMAFNKEGGIGNFDGVDRYMKDGAKTQFISGPPRVYAAATPENGNFIVIEGRATLIAPTSDSKLVTVTPDYTVKIRPVGNGKWIITEMTWIVVDVALTDSVAAPEAPNGK